MVGQQATAVLYQCLKLTDIISFAQSNVNLPSWVTSALYFIGPIMPHWHYSYMAAGSTVPNSQSTNTALNNFINKFNDISPSYSGTWENLFDKILVNGLWGIFIGISLFSNPHIGLWSLGTATYNLSDLSSFAN